MPTISEQKLTFTFPDTWQVSKYDEENLFIIKKHCLNCRLESYWLKILRILGSSVKGK